MGGETKIKISFGRVGAKLAVNPRRRSAAKKNIKKAQSRWKAMTSRERALAQPEGRARARPGTVGGGDFYRITIRPKSSFVMFRTHDVGKKGHLERIAGKRKNGNWDTQCWLVGKEDAEVKGVYLVGKTKAVKDLLKTLGSKPKLVRGDVFKARVRKNVPEKSKPIPKMKAAQKKNIKKAQEVRRNK